MEHRSVLAWLRSHRTGRIRSVRSGERAIDDLGLDEVLAVGNEAHVGTRSMFSITLVVGETSTHAML